jgi:hypothetical protein
MRDDRSLAQSIIVVTLELEAATTSTAHTWESALME